MNDRIWKHRLSSPGCFYQKVLEFKKKETKSGHQVCTDDGLILSVGRSEENRTEQAFKLPPLPVDYGCEIQQANMFKYFLWYKNIVPVRTKRI